MKTISQLITELQAVLAGAGDVPVLVDGIHGGYNPPGGLRIVEVSEDPERENQGCFGRFDDANALDADLPKFDAVVIER